jgi:hypothetical protein
MTIRVLIACLVVAGTFVSLESATAATSRAEERAVIRSMPMGERPNRPGHFYGNTVRRMSRFGR